MRGPEQVISSKKTYQMIDISEIWRYRELSFIFIWRDIKVRYKQTVLGIVWVLFQPLLTAGIFTFFFQKILLFPQGQLPYSLSVLCGLVCWNYFSTTITAASESFLSYEGMLKKVYFPRLLLPLTSVMAGLVDLGIVSIMLFLMCTISGYPPKLGSFIVFPVAIALLISSSFSIGAFLSALNIRYRDVRYILPFFIQLLLFLSPVIYPSSIVSASNMKLLALNPVTSAIDMLRWMFTPHQVIPWEIYSISIISCAVSLVFSLWYFSKTEDIINDAL